MTCSRVHQLINTRQWIAILGVGFVYIGEVYTHSPFAISLLDYYYIGQPVWIINPSNKLYYSQLLNLFFNGIVCLRGKHTFLLSYRLRGRIYI